jgi:NTE family protein
MGSKIGVVLGGGGSRGIAHIGVLQVLEREQVPIDLVVGTSMGGIVGALFALGVTPQELADQLHEVRDTSIIHVKRWSSTARQRMLRELLADPLAGKTFADLKIPAVLTAVDMVTGREVALKEGPLLPAVLATAALPAVFPPVAIDGMLLADGGVIDSLAVPMAYENGAERVIAVDVEPDLDEANPWVDPLSAVMGFDLPFGIFNATEADDVPSVLAAAWRAMRVQITHIHRERLAAHPPDVLLRPDVHHYGSLDFTDLQGPLEAGISEAEAKLPDIRALLARG